MSTTELAFALDQSKLEPAEQLALIIVADNYAEYFDLKDAILCIVKRTSLPGLEATKILDSLVAKRIIRESSYKRLKDNTQTPVYFIQTVQR